MLYFWTFTHFDVSIKYNPADKQQLLVVPRGGSLFERTVLDAPGDSGESRQPLSSRILQSWLIVSLTAEGWPSCLQGLSRSAGLLQGHQREGRARPCEWAPWGPGGTGACSGLWLKAIVVGEVGISKAQKWASLAKIVGHEALIHSLCSCQSGICKMENQVLARRLRTNQAALRGCPEQGACCWVPGPSLGQALLSCFPGVGAL